MEEAKAWYWVAELEFLKTSGEAIGEGEASVTVGTFACWRSQDEGMAAEHRASTLCCRAGLQLRNNVCCGWQRGRSRTARASGVQIMSALPMSHTELQDLNFTPELGFCYDLIVTVL